MTAAMTEGERHVFSTIKDWVWSGFHDPAAIRRLLSTISEPGVSEAWMLQVVDAEFAKKAAEETTWPRITDCDRLDAAFAALERRGVCALQNAGFSLNDGFAEVAEELRVRKRAHKGFCFFHEQDLSAAMAGRGLHIAFGAVNRGDLRESLAIGKTVRDALTRQGFRVDWDGTQERRPHIPEFDWKRRL